MDSYEVQRRVEARRDVRTGGSDDGLVDDGEDGGNIKKNHESVCPQREGAGASSKGVPDMYKALDGSALVAIGGLISAKVHIGEPELNFARYATTGACIHTSKTQRSPWVEKRNGGGWATSQRREQWSRK